jgi:PAS domain S-box-containing protein
VEQVDNQSFFLSKEFHTFFTNSPRSLVLKADAPLFTILAVSDHYLNLVHKQRHELLGKGLFEVFPGSAGDLSEQYSVHNSFLRVIDTGKVDELPIFKYEIVTDDAAGKKETLYWTNLNEPIFGADGKVAYIINTTTNITDRIRLEQALEEGQQRERALNNDLALSNQDLTAINEELAAINEELQVTNHELSESNSALQTAIEQLNTAREAAQLGLFDWDLINHTYAWDERFKRMFGLPAEHSPDHYSVMVSRLHPDDRERVKKAVADARNFKLTGGRYDVEYRIIGAGDVPVRWAWALGRVIFDQLGTPVRFIGTLMDITDQVLVLQQLQASKDRLNLAIESADLGTWFINAETREVTSSARLKEMFGFNVDDEMPLAAAIDQIPDEYREMVAAAINRAIEKGESYDIEYPVIGFRDQKLRWVRATGKLYPGVNNETPIFSGTIMDITEQKQNEQRKNDFISMVSHELKTPLTSTISYVQVAKRKAAAAGDGLTAGMLERAGIQLGKMTTLINGFLNVARLEAGKIHIEKKELDMAVLVKEIENDVLAEVNSHKIIFEPIGETWVNVDKDKIEQVINNLISNAIKYSPPQTTIQIACVTQVNYAHVSVKDEGLGIRQQDQQKLFDRFYRVEDQGNKSISGFGIGLYICKEIIERHDGTIGVESEPGKGSTFWFTLPVIKKHK